MKKYEFKKDILGKKLNVKLRGQFNTQEGMEYISEYNKQVDSLLKKEDYSLNIDCSEMKVTASDTTDALEYCFKLYKSAGFKNITFITKGNPTKTIMNMQFRRLGRNAGLNFEIIE